MSKKTDWQSMLNDSECFSKSEFCIVDDNTISKKMFSVYVLLQFLVLPFLSNSQSNYDYFYYTKCYYCFII